jgi:hypothetical protein
MKDLSMKQGSKLMIFVGLLALGFLFGHECSDGWRQNIGAFGLLVGFGGLIWDEI